MTSLMEAFGRGVEALHGASVEASGPSRIILIAVGALVCLFVLGALGSWARERMAGPCSERAPRVAPSLGHRSGWIQAR